MKQTRSAGGIILNEKGLVCVVNQNGRSWSLPKGHIEKGEEPLEAALREIKEETGIVHLEFIRELGTYERHKIGKDGSEDRSEQKRITFFLFRTDENDLLPEDPDNPEARWVKKEEVAELMTHPKDKEFFLKVKEELP